MDRWLKLWASELPERLREFRCVEFSIHIKIMKIIAKPTQRACSTDYTFGDLLFIIWKIISIICNASGKVLPSLRIFQGQLRRQKQLNSLECTMNIFKFRTIFHTFVCFIMDNCLLWKGKNPNNIATNMMSQICTVYFNHIIFQC